MDINLRLALRKYAADPSDENAQLAATAALRADGAETAPVEGVLTVSAKHLSARELEILSWRVIPNFPHHVERSDVGHDKMCYWLYCPDLTKITPRGYQPMIYTDPEYANAGNLVTLAVRYGCDWLRIVPNGPTISNLPIFS